MPVKSARWCGRCKTAHAGDCPLNSRWNKQRLQQPQRLRGRPWLRLRAQVFARDGYLCQACLAAGKQTIIKPNGDGCGICDHIVPLTQGGTDDLDNLQTLCRRCSDIKTYQESLAGRQGVGQN